MFRRKGKIPPPLNPVIDKSEPADPYDIQLPYALADQARIFLHFLAKNTKIGEDAKALIIEWLEKYDTYLTEWLLEAYGFWGWMAANEITVHVSEQFYAAARGAVDGAEAELFQRLEEEMGDGDADSA
jgi:hypothetical protein